MRKLRALVSFTTAVADQAFRSDHLKLCFLWYDEVLFETVGNYDESQYFKRLVGSEPNANKTIRHLTDLILPLKSRVSHDAIGDVLDPDRLGYPRWGKNHEYYTYENPESAEQYAHNWLLKNIEAEKGVDRFEGYDLEQAEGRSRIAVDAVQLWERVNSEIPCMLQAGKDEQSAMMAARQFRSGTDNSISPYSLFEASVPSLSTVSWQDVVRLRRNGGLESLREKLQQAVDRSTTDIVSAKKLFRSFEDNATDSIVENSRPNIKKVSIESALGNIPGIPFNPFSAFFGVRDVTNTIQSRKDLGWLYLLRDIRKAAVHPPVPPP